MNTKHTPGPWIAIPDATHRDHQLIVAIGPEHTGLDVASVRPWMTHDEANARLIAAAPDLLAACKRAEELLSSITDIRSDLAEFQNAYLSQLRWAIAKVEGK